jgi:hypothetical protein
MISNGDSNNVTIKPAAVQHVNAVGPGKLQAAEAVRCNQNAVHVILTVQLFELCACVADLLVLCLLHAVHAGSFKMAPSLISKWCFLGRGY